MKLTRNFHHLSDVILLDKFLLAKWLKMTASIKKKFQNVSEKNELTGVSFQPRFLTEHISDFRQ